MSQFPRVAELPELTYDSNLSFIAISKDPDFDKEKSLIDYNVGVLRDTLLKVLDYV